MKLEDFESILKIVKSLNLISLHYMPGDAARKDICEAMTHLGYAAEKILNDMKTDEDEGDDI